MLFELARGGMGVVYAARAKGASGATVAIKLMSESAIEHRKHVDMFLDEVWIASSVKDEHVVEVLDAGEHEGLPFLVMEYVAGVSLLEVMRAADAPPVDVVCGILAATARGLHAAHETLDPDGAPLHVVHRDVSPHNVLVGFDGRVKVTDFGVAAARGRRTQTTSGEIKGKVSYMSPEQITREQTTDRRADVWALGVIAWEALSGRKLFTGIDDAQRMFAVLRDPIPSLSAVAPTTPEAISAIVAKALSRNVEERIPTAEAFAIGMDGTSATTGAIATWMRAHFASRERALEESFSASAHREPTAVTTVLTTRASEAAADASRPRRTWAPAIGLALLVLIAAGVTMSTRAPTAEPVARSVPPSPPPSAAPIEVIAPVAEAPPEEVVTAVPDVVAPPPQVETPHRARSPRSSRRTRSIVEPSPAPSTPPPSTADRPAASRLLDNPFAHP